MPAKMIANELPGKKYGYGLWIGSADPQYMVSLSLSASFDSGLR